MALQDFLGKTPELKIIDFLAENMDRRYSKKEIREFAGISRIAVNNTLPKLITNDVVEVGLKADQITYHLVDNELVAAIVAISLVHSFTQRD